MSRHFVRKGDKTTANGDVLEGEQNYMLAGIPVAFHGAKVYCPACNNVGAIVTIPPHHPFTVNGKQIALEGDLCLCKCSTPPRLIASQSMGRMSFEGTTNAKTSQAGLSDSLGVALPPLASAASRWADEDARMEQAAHGDPRFWTAQVGPPAPGTVGSPPANELSGSQWVTRYPTSTSISDLISPFREHVEAFISALQAAGATVSVNATLRPPERVYLMHYSYSIANGADPSGVPAMAGVAIDWVHHDSSGGVDLSASKSAAQDMASGYDIAYPPALSSRHTEGRAVDMTVGNFVGKTFTDGSGTNSTVTNQSDLETLGASYGVIKLRSDPPHWSDDGH